MPYGVIIFSVATQDGRVTIMTPAVDVALAVCLAFISNVSTMTLAATGVASPLGAPPIPLALALSAGILTTLNPCGFVLLPAYVAYVLHGPGDWQGVTGSSTGWQVLRSGLLGVPLTAGFLLI